MTLVWFRKGLCVWERVSKKGVGLRDIFKVEWIDKF